MIGRALIIVPIIALASACVSLPVENPAINASSPVATVPIRWRVTPGCLNKMAQTQGEIREDISQSCRDNKTRDLISVALSGGGTKAAVFSGETLFYLDFLGLLERTSVVSAVSGGSFAGTLYALSCDPGTPCQNIHPHARERPLWNYPDIMETLGQGYTK